MPRNSTTASIAALIEPYESEKVSTTSASLPIVVHASLKSSTGTWEGEVGRREVSK